MYNPIRTLSFLAGLLVIAGCTEPGTGASYNGAQGGKLAESVAALAAPGQNLATVRILPDDNCYWYEHAGPVETTLLPLRAADGRPICAGPA